MVLARRGAVPDKARVNNEIEMLARLAGLGRAWLRFPKDVADAVTGAAELSAAFDHPADPTDEPTPAMHMDRE